MRAVAIFVKDPVICGEINANVLIHTYNSFVGGKMIRCGFMAVVDLCLVS